MRRRPNRQIHQNSQCINVQEGRKEVSQVVRSIYESRIQFNKANVSASHISGRDAFPSKSSGSRERVTFLYNTPNPGR